MSARVRKMGSYVITMFDPSIFFSEGAVGRQFRIKKGNKDGSMLFMKIVVRKAGGQYHDNIYVEELTAGTSFWLPVQDILDAKRIDL